MESSVKASLRKKLSRPYRILIAITSCFLMVQYFFTNDFNYKTWHIQWRIQSTAMPYIVETEAQEE